MTWQDIDWQRGIIQLRGTKTAAALRIVPLHDELRAILRPLACRPTSAVLEKWGNVCRDLAALCHQLSIPPVTPNDLRRTFGSWMAQGKVSSHRRVAVAVDSDLHRWLQLDRSRIPLPKHTRISREKQLLGEVQ